MRFGTVPLEKAVGAILAHTFRGPGGTIRKGTRLDRDAVAAIRAAGEEAIVAALLEPDDVHEDAAAAEIARRAAGEAVTLEPAFTGRCNLFSAAAGILVVNGEGIDGLNRIDPDITLATLDRFRRVEPGRMIATVKIIPFAVGGSDMAAARNHLAATGPLVAVAPFQLSRVAAVSTLLPALKPATVDKTIRVLTNRLEGTGAFVSDDRRVPHETKALAGALAGLANGPDELIVVFGASAVVDRRDVIPAAIEAAGGVVHHFGMPVDPGNLLLVGELGGKRVIGAPGCARSPKENGFDWVLDRFLAGRDVAPDDITGMGVGGLLMEIVSRPQPRDRPATTPKVGAPRIGAIVLAAGRSSRMGQDNKLLLEIGGKPMVRHAAAAAIASRATPIVVVTGHESDEVAAALGDLDVEIRHNPDFRAGLSTSLAAGLAALPEGLDGAVVLLGDMPAIGAADIDRLVAAFDPEAGRMIVLSTRDGRRGNPVLWAARFFPELSATTGDVGGRDLVAAYPEATTEVEIGPAAAADIDTPEALAAYLSDGAKGAADDPPA